MWRKKMAEQGCCFGRSPLTSPPHINLTPEAIKFQGLCLILLITVTENNFEEKKNFAPQFKKKAQLIMAGK